MELWRGGGAVHCVSAAPRQDDGRSVRRGAKWEVQVRVEEWMPRHALRRRLRMGALGCSASHGGGVRLIAVLDNTRHGPHRTACDTQTHTPAHGSVCVCAYVCAGSCVEPALLTSSRAIRAHRASTFVRFFPRFPYGPRRNIDLDKADRVTQRDRGEVGRGWRRGQPAPRWTTHTHTHN